MPAKPAIYKSFLIRIWSGETHQTQRVMVVRISENNEQYYFTTLDDLMIFLLQEMEGPSKGALSMA